MSAMLLNASPIRRFHWSEPFSFSRARAAAKPESGRLRITAILTVLFAAPLLLAKFPETMAGLGVVTAVSVASALLVSQVILPLASRLPRSVSVMTDSFVIGRQRLWFIEIEHAVVGTTVLGKNSFPVLSFRTRGGQNYLFGLSEKVQAQELADFLVRVGVNGVERDRT